MTPAVPLIAAQGGWVGLYNSIMDNVCFISKNDYLELYCAYELYLKFSSVRKSAEHLEIHFKGSLSPEAYLPRLKQFLDLADETPSPEIITLNPAKTIYYLPYFWLKQIGKAKKELAQNLKLNEKDFSQVAAKK
jgi:hypothetical protein